MPSIVLGIQWRTKETQSLPLAFSASANSFCSPSYILGQRDHAALFGHLKRESMERERYREEIEWRKERDSLFQLFALHEQICSVT